MVVMFMKMNQNKIVFFSGLDNVVMTPHIGASTVEAQEKVAYQIAEQIVEFIKNNKIINQVNK